MPPSDYTSTGGGLKLKGAKDANVDKKRNKKKKKTKDKDRTASISKDPSPHPPDPEAADKSTSSSSKAAQALQDEEESIQTQDVSAREVRDFGKTEAQRRHEERRRKTVCYAPCNRTPENRISC